MHFLQNIWKKLQPFFSGLPLILAMGHYLLLTSSSFDFSLAEKSSQVSTSMKMCWWSPVGPTTCIIDRRWMIQIFNQAMSWQAPPTALIFLSAFLLKNFALTTTGCAGRNPLPSTLKKPAFVTSMTGTLVLSFEQWAKDVEDTRLHSLSRLTVGKCSLFLCIPNCLIPILPKQPGWYRSIAVRL